MKTEDAWAWVDALLFLHSRTGDLKEQEFYWALARGVKDYI